MVAVGSIESSLKFKIKPSREYTVGAGTAGAEDEGGKHNWKRCSTHRFT